MSNKKYGIYLIYYIYFWFYDFFGSDLEPDPEPAKRFGSSRIRNTGWMFQFFCFSELLLQPMEIENAAASLESMSCVSSVPLAATTLAEAPPKPTGGAVAKFRNKTNKEKKKKKRDF